MKKAYIFGAGETGKKIFREQKKYEIIGFIDSNLNYCDCEQFLFEFPIFRPKHLEIAEFDTVIVGAINGFSSIIKQLNNIGICEDKIDTSFISPIDLEVRPNFLRQFSDLCKLYNIKGDVAEAGVFQGEFAKHINGYFSDEKLYLFDTFKGFDEKDIGIENAINAKTTIFTLKEFFLHTSEELVLSKMKYPQNCILRKGYFPETTLGLEDKKFCFVNLDMDLYKPTYEGLKFFYPRMVDGGCILIHDYFSEAYPKVQIAVSDFEKEIGIKLYKLPIGDNTSLAIIK